jgi:pimeloyl-ACP methyl ester carboxylesterase
MKPLAADLVGAGFTVCNIDYPSRSAAPEELVAEIAGDIEACGAGSAPRTHFVGHSLGGILARAYLAENRPANLGRVVMLASPNHGNEYVDLLAGSDVFRWLLGPTWAELGTDEKSLPRRLPPPSYELGVIAGTWSMNPFAGWVLDGQHDGLVSVESTKLAGMTDFLTVERSHPFILRADEVAAAVVHFLYHGRIEK